jgi:hypothetical protein
MILWCSVKDAIPCVWLHIFYLTFFLLLVPDAAVDGVDEKKDAGAAGKSSSPRKGKEKSTQPQQEQEPAKKLKPTTIEKIPDPILVGI